MIHINDHMGTYFETSALGITLGSASMVFSLYICRVLIKCAGHIHEELHYTMYEKIFVYHLNGSSKPLICFV